jgi:cell wall-associated NlpC family hydrolase
MEPMMHRLLVTALAGAALVVPATAPADARSSGSASWAQREIRVVVARGLMAPDVRSFRPDDDLTRGELAQLESGLTGRPARRAAGPDSSVTMAELDKRLVGVLALTGPAAAFTGGARAAGLKTPSRFGTEIVARLLGLRTNHPAGQDDLERFPTEPAPRAEAAFSVARLLELSPRNAEYASRAALTFSLPPLGVWQQRILETAFSLIGAPYVWGGETEAEGGFDCSGFVWRVYKLQRYPDSGRLAETLKGRTTFAMSGEFPRAQRLEFADLVPGDLVFFGAAGPRSKPAQIDHMGIYVGSGWMAHSSRFGTTLVPLEAWYRTRFAWGRRPLAEAGLAPAPASTPPR